MSTAIKQEPTAQDTFVALLTRDFWPIAIYPAGVTIPYREKPATGKEPIGKSWGDGRWTVDRGHRAFKENPGAGVGLCLGPGRGPGNLWLIDAEVDGPGGEESRTKLMGGEIIPTMGWFATRGDHLTYTADPDRLAKIMPALKALEARGLVGTGVYKSPELPGLELRIGGYKPDGTIKQIQSVVPPTIGTNGVARAWNGVWTVAEVPEAFYVFLESLAAKLKPEPKPAAQPTQARDGQSSGRFTPEVRAVLYLQKCGPAISGAKGHDQAFKVACKVGPGFDLHPDTALKLIRDVWNPTCEPPWSDRELEHKIAQAYDLEKRRGWLLDEPRKTFNVVSPEREERAEPGTVDIINGSSDPSVEPEIERGVTFERAGTTDTGNAFRMIRDHGDKLRYCVDWGKWLRWDGKRWKMDKKGSINRVADITVKQIWTEAINSGDDADRKALLRWAQASESKKNKDAMISLARFIDSITAVETCQLDRDPWLLNVRNGTIDLKTGELRPHRREDLITKLANVDYVPDATCPRWDQFELEIMDQNSEMVSYLRRIAGYAITGDIREHMLFFFYGGGRNGKSMWLGVIQHILGDYATTVDANLITSKQNDDHPTGLTDLEGRRFVSTIEVEDGKKMAEALVKKLTGGDRIKARKMRQDFYEFDPVHKLILAANHKPVIRGTDEAIWARVKLVPFPIRFVETDEEVDHGQKRFLMDKTIGDKLKAESTGILATLVRACLEWQQGGMKEPSTVARATAAYRAESDRVNAFVQERCLVGDQYRVKMSLLYEAFKVWAKSSGETEITKRMFGDNLTTRGIGPKESNGVSWRLGIALRNDIDDGFETQSSNF
jgi:putative DNA primase/helicase